jgi:hypothetical protein
VVLVLVQPPRVLQIERQRACNGMATQIRLTLVCTGSDFRTAMYRCLYVYVWKQELSNGKDYLPPVEPP